MAAQTNLPADQGLGEATPAGPVQAIEGGLSDVFRTHKTKSTPSTMI